MLFTLHMPLPNCDRRREAEGITVLGLAGVESTRTINPILYVPILVEAERLTALIPKPWHGAGGSHPTLTQVTLPLTLPCLGLHVLSVLTLSSSTSPSKTGQSNVAPCYDLAASGFALKLSRMGEVSPVDAERWERLRRLSMCSVH